MILRVTRNQNFRQKPLSARHIAIKQIVHQCILHHANVTNN